MRCCSSSSRPRSVRVTSDVFSRPMRYGPCSTRPSSRSRRRSPLSRSRRDVPAGPGGPSRGRLERRRPSRGCAPQTREGRTDRSRFEPVVVDVPRGRSRSRENTSRGSAGADWARSCRRCSHDSGPGAHVRPDEDRSHATSADSSIAQVAMQVPQHGIAGAQLTVHVRQLPPGVAEEQPASDAVVRGAEVQEQSTTIAGRWCTP